MTLSFTPLLNIVIAVVVLNVALPVLVFSKIFILGILGFAQIMFFYISIRYFLVLDGNPILFILTLYLSLMAGTSLGLLISAFVSTDVMALSLVPVFLIPQLLFSKLIMPNKSMDSIVESLEQLTLVKWGYDSLEQIVSSEIKMMIVFKSSFILIIMIIIMTFLSWLLLKVKDTAE
ncbi:MAG: ABC transporter permease [Candidatus Sericytochromatia bacterium]